MAEKSFFTSPAFIVTASLLTAGTGVYAYSKISKKIKERKAEGAANQVDSKDPKKALVATLAQRAYTAFFPWGYPGVWDGTDEAELYAVAREMYKNKISFASLAESYRKLYTRQFAQDLVDELDSDELARFYSNLQKGLGGSITKTGNKTLNLI